MDNNHKKILNIMLVEDNPSDSALFKVMLERSKLIRFKLRSASSLKETLELLDAIDYDIILLDLNLPDSEGLDTLSRLRDKDKNTPVVVVSGVFDEKTGLDAITMGAQDYLVKGTYDVNLLVKTINYAIERKRSELDRLEDEKKLAILMSNLPGMAYRYRNDNRCSMEFVSNGCLQLTGYRPDDIVNSRKTSYLNIIHPEDVELVKKEKDKFIRNGQAFQVSYRIVTAGGEIKWVWEQGRGIFSREGELHAVEGFISDITQRKLSEEKLQKSYIKLAKTLEETVNILATTVETRDPYTAGHQKRVAQLSHAIAGELGLSEQVIRGIYLAALVHDIGKIHIPIGILINPRKLTPTEFSIIKTHAQIGFDILKTIEFPWPIADIVLQHHERMNGSGYPRGIKDDKILDESRILAVADVVEAMASHRPYRPALGIESALDEISKNKGTLYDVKVVEACIVLFRHKNFNFDKYLIDKKTPLPHLTV